MAPRRTVAAAPTPPGGPATVPAVKAYLRLSGTGDDDVVAAAVDAVNAFTARLPYAATKDDAGAVVGWPADVTQGAVMLAARMFRRRNSPAGVEAFTDIGGAVYVQRNDPDVAILLGIGAYAKPIVG